MQVPAPKAMVDWQKAVKAAKRKLNIPSNTYITLKGELLKTARRIYCMMGY